MAKKTINSDIYNIVKLIDDLKHSFIPNESEETLAISTYGYLGAIESNRLQTQVRMTGELCNEVFPSRARLERNVLTHAIMANIENINALPAKMIVFLAIKEKDIENYFDPITHVFVIDRECPIQIGDFEFHLEYDIKLKKIKITNNVVNINSNQNMYAYTAQYDIPNNRDVPTSTITIDNQFLDPPIVANVNNESYIYITVILSQVEHISISKKLISSNVVDNKTMNFSFDNQLAYFEVRCIDGTEEVYLTPTFEGTAPLNLQTKYYCWYQYIDTNLIRVRFDRKSYMPDLNSTVECLIKTCRGTEANFIYNKSEYISLQSSKYGYKNISCIVTPVTDSRDGRNRKSKQELQGLIPKEMLSRGCLTTITDLNNYFSMIDSEYGRIIIQKKIDNQIERVYYAYLVAKDINNNIIPANTIDIQIGLNDLIESQVYSTDPPRFILPAGKCFRLGTDGIAYINNSPILSSLNEFTPESIPRGEYLEDEFEVEVVSNEFDPVSCGVNVGGNDTRTHVFPSESEENRYIIPANIPDDITLVEDYIQMGVGQKYLYSSSYIAKTGSVIIQAADDNLPCFDFIEGYYTANGETKKFSSLPAVVYNLPENTKITFNIINKLNLNAKGIIYFNWNQNIYKFNQITTGKLSTILKSYGIVGQVIAASSSHPDKLLLTENGTITPPIPEDTSYKLFVSTNDNLPDLANRHKNEWFYVIESSEVQSTQDVNNPSTEQERYTLTVVNEAELPPLDNRPKNNWYYVIEKSSKIIDSYVPENQTPFTSSDYVLNTALDADMPDLSNREKDNWWYAIHRSEFYKEIPDPPESQLTGKEYDIDIIDNFENSTIVIHVLVDEIEYDIIVTQDRHVIENGITIIENESIVQNTSYLTYVPTLDQNIWPSMLMVGSRIKYKLKYKSTSNKYKPKVTIALSKGLRYVSLSNYVTYPDGTKVQLEPTTITAENKTEFIYTNPYAISINGYRLYSAFYMMAINENPYLHFDYINDNSNIQFISTNIQWNRPFTGSNTDVYTLSCTLTQSVQNDLGLMPSITDKASVQYFAPLVKLIAVFERNGKPYRYRSMNLESYDYSSYSYTFSQVFNSKDIFDNDNNIKITNVQIAGQQEYTVLLSYNNKSYTLVNGEVTTLSTILEKLEIGITVDNIYSAISDNPDALDVHPNYDATDYEVRSLIDFAQTTTIRIITNNYAETDYLITATCTSANTYKVHIGDTYSTTLNLYGIIHVSDILNYYQINYETIKSASFSISTQSVLIEPVIEDDQIIDINIIIKREFSNNPGILTIDYDDTNINYQMSSTAAEYGFFAPNTTLKLYALCGLPDASGEYFKYNLDSICPGLNRWTLTNIYNVARGISMYHNYSEIMGSMCTPYGDSIVGEDNKTTLKLKGYYIKNIPMFGYEYCQDEILAQRAIDALNYRKAYIDSTVELLENSFGIDFKLFNTYGPSQTYYIIKDKNENNVLDDEIEFIKRVNLNFYFRIKLVSNSDSYTKDNITKEIKEYIEDLNDIGELHIPNLITQISNNYSEQISYFEYLGFNEYGPDVQHIYKVSDNEIPIHTAPEFLNINNIVDYNGIAIPNITIYVSEM